VSKRVNNEKESLMAKWSKRSDYNAMMYLRSDVKEGKEGKNHNESGHGSSGAVEDENEANSIEIEKMDEEIGNQYDNVKSII
jgi:hypothetical protein